MSAAVKPALARPEPWLATALRVLVHAITAGVIAFPLTVPEAVGAAVVGAALGSLIARFVARSTLRLPAILLIGAGSLLGVFVLRFFVVDLSVVPEMLGPSTALVTGDAVVFGLGALVVSTVLRALSARRPSFSILEAALVAGGFATLLIAHRNGAIHRPYEIADPLIARGEDPTVAILVIGAAGAAVVGLLLLSERSLVRSVFHLGVVVALLLLILGTTTMVGLPTPPSTGGALGLQDDEGQASRQQGGQGQQQGRRRSDELEFLDQYPQGGGTPDAVIIFHDDYSPDGGYYYFRQSAFSQYNGRKLIAATRQDVDQDIRNMFPTNRSRDVAWIPELGDDRTEVETTVAMLADNSAPLGLEAPVRFVPATNPNAQRFRRVYRVESRSTTADLMSLLGRSVGDPTWSEDVREHYTRGPDDPRYRELAERIVSALPEDLRDDPMAKALAITQYLGEHGTYSLRSRHASAEDPTADFLFGDLTGYCVHFAHAGVYLMRSIGIPARVGTGYAVAEANRQGGSALLLRNSDQHAWPEVYVGPAASPVGPMLDALRALQAAQTDAEVDAIAEEQRRAAVMIVEIVAREADVADPDDASEDEMPALSMPDVSSGAGTRAELARLAEESGQSSDELLSAAIARLESVPAPPSSAAGWIVADVAPQNVLDPPGEPPDPQLQRLLGEMARGSEALADAPQPPRPMAQLAREFFASFGEAVGGLIGCIFGFLFGTKTWRRLAPRFVARPRLIYRAALDRLSDGGLRRRWGESPEAFAQRVARSLPALKILTNGHLAAAFGGHDDARRVAAMMQADRALRIELRRAVPLWRRLLGLIDPFSWLLTR